MNEQIATAMGRALEKTRAGNPSEATRILQAALNGISPSGQATWQGADDAPASARRPLGQVIDSLVNGKAFRGTPVARPAVRPAIHDGARYEARRHAGAYGARDYRLFVPSDRAEPIQGLVMMLHGCTQNADDFAAGTQMNGHGERHNLVIVYPDQTRQANQMGCWNWFQPEHQGRGRGEPAILAELAAEVADEFDVPTGETFVAGLSAGGAMAAILGENHPEVFAAVGVHSGLAPGSASDIASAYAAMSGKSDLNNRAGYAKATPVRSIVFHGSNDTTVSPVNADAVIAAAIGAEPTTQIDDASVQGATVTLHHDAAGRTIAECWTLPGIGHAWSGGSQIGSYTHPAGPDASAEFVRFFLGGATGDRK